MEGSKMAVTIRDVAKAAGVSPSTVSRVLTNNPKISEETKLKVKEAIEKLNYRPNAIARSLANKSTRTIGIMLPNEADDIFKNPFFIQAMTGISGYAKENGYYIIFSFSKSEEEEIEIIEDFVSSNLVDGIILLTVRTNDKAIEFLKKENISFSVIGRPNDTQDILWVDNDNFQAMYNVVSSLLQHGKRDIAFLGAGMDLNVSKDRLNGYIQAHNVHGIKVDENYIYECNKFDENEGYKAAKRILKYKLPKAIVVTDDLLAFGVNKALKEANIKDVALVGFNNIPLSEYQDPPLASVDINAQKLGYYASKVLIDKLKNVKNSNAHYIVETKLIERESALLK